MHITLDNILKAEERRHQRARRLARAAERLQARSESAKLNLIHLRERGPSSDYPLLRANLIADAHRFAILAAKASDRAVGVLMGAA